jgi:hypothetical protein
MSVLSHHRIGGRAATAANFFKTLFLAKASMNLSLANSG